MDLVPTAIAATEVTHALSSQRDFFGDLSVDIQHFLLILSEPLSLVMTAIALPSDKDTAPPFNHAVADAPVANWATDALTESPERFTKALPHAHCDLRQDTDPAQASTQTSAPTPAPTSAQASTQTSAPTPAPTSAQASTQTSAPASTQTSAPTPTQTSAPTPTQTSAPTSAPTLDSRCDSWQEAETEGCHCGGGDAEHACAEGESQRASASSRSQRSGRPSVPVPWPQGVAQASPIPSQWYQVELRLAWQDVQQFVQLLQPAAPLYPPRQPNDADLQQALIFSILLHLTEDFYRMVPSEFTQDALQALLTADAELDRTGAATQARPQSPQGQPRHTQDRASQLPQSQDGAPHDRDRGARHTPGISPAPSQGAPWSWTATPPPSMEPSFAGDRILDTMTEAIRKSRELPQILQQAIDQVQLALQSDRVLIYQLQVHLNSLKLWRQSDNMPVPTSWADPQWQHVSDCVTYEARAHSHIPSVLYAGADQCLLAPWELAHLDRLSDQPWMVILDALDQDREGAGPAGIPASGAQTPASSAEFGVKSGSQAGSKSGIGAGSDAGSDAGSGTGSGTGSDAGAIARSQLAVPITLHSQEQDEIWGWLVVQHCTESRSWSSTEVTFLKRLSRLLALGIHQAQISAHSQNQRQIIDLTIQDRTQALRDALIGAQTANRVKSEFLAAMSHELRTPLTCVIGLSATLLRWSFGQLNQRQRDYLQTIHDSGQHLLSLINDILDLSQVEAGRTALNVSEFSIMNCMQQTVTLAREKALRNNIHLEVDLKITADQDRFRADLYRLGQITSNLLSNAIKFTPSGGQAILRVWRDDGGLAIQVEDDGIGIPDDQIESLFEKFQQVDASYHRTYGGLGLGLAMTKHLVELHKGWIEVESVVGSGSTFTVWIPSQPLQPPTSTKSLKEEVIVPHGTIVLIDGQEERAMAICDILTAAGYQVVWTIDGSIALAQMEVLNPTIAVISARLPGMLGSEIVAILREHPHTAAIKILSIGQLEAAVDDPDPEFDQGSWDAADLSDASATLPDTWPSQVADDWVSDPINLELLLHKVDDLARQVILEHRLGAVAPPKSV